MKYIFYGAFGAGNLGDDLLLLAALNEYSPENSLIVSYAKPAISNVEAWVELSKFQADLDCYIEKDDFLVFAGGGIFWSSEHCELLALIANFAKNKNVTIHIKRIGAQGLEFNPNAVLSFLNAADMVSFRDSDSAFIIKQEIKFSNCIVEDDYVMTLRDYLISHEFCNKKNVNDQVVTIGINHAQTEFYENMHFRYRLIRIYCELIDKLGGGYRFIYIPQVRHITEINQNDLINGEIFSVMTGGKIKTCKFPSSVDELLEIYSQIDLFVGCRYHGMVISNLMNINSILLTIPCGSKYDAFAADYNVPTVDLDFPEEKIVLDIVDYVKKFTKTKRIH
jgi:polysaccharide pyruvyl transferase WcaK-like protein